MANEALEITQFLNNTIPNGIINFQKKAINVGCSASKSELGKIEEIKNDLINYMGVKKQENKEGS